MADKEKALALRELREKQLENALEMAMDTEQDKQLVAKWNQEAPVDKEPEEKQISIAEEYRLLLEGRRVTGRRSQTQTVLEKQKQEQLELLQQQKWRHKEKMQQKRHKQKLEKLLSKNDQSEGEDSIMSNTLKHVSDVAGPKQRRDCKTKDKSRTKDLGSRTHKSERGFDLSRSQSEASKIFGKKRKAWMGSDQLSQESDANRGHKRLDFTKEAKPFKTEGFSKEQDRYTMALPKSQLFGEPDLNIELDSDDKSDSSYEEPRRNAILQNQSQTTILEQNSPLKVSGKHCFIDMQTRPDPNEQRSKYESRHDQSPQEGYEKNISPSKQKGVKDFQDQLREFMLLDKIIPDIKQTKGCYVQVVTGDSARIGQIISLDDDWVKVRIHATQAEEKVPVRNLRFLTRAYTCLVEDLDQKQMPSELSSIIGHDPQQFIVLVQMVYTMQAEHSSEDPETKSLKIHGQSVHRLNALVPLGDKDFRLQPVTFVQGSKRQVQKKELNLSLKDEDLENEIRTFCYRDETVARQALTHARIIHQAWKDNYLERTERVEVTPDNISDLLFTICNFSERGERFDREQEREKEQGQSVPSFRSAKVKVGILLSYRMDGHCDEQTVWAFFKLFPFKVNQKERVEWVRLDKFQVISNESLGFVQLASLGIQDTHSVNNPLAELKLRQLKMISKAESQMERQVNLQQKMNLARINPDTAATEAAYFISQKCKVETCKICKYQTNLDGVKFFNCSKCSENFHYKCLEEHQRNLGVSEKHWRCPDCVRCSCCYSQRHKEQMLICKNCNTSVHYECLATPYRNRLKAYPSSENVEPQNALAVPQTMLPAEFICECCIQCQNCLSRDAGEKKQNKWSKDFKFCSSCNKKRERKEYCSICERFWPSEEEGKELMLKCGLCKTWVHLDCDRMLTDKGTRDKFVGSENCLEILNTNKDKAILASLKHSTLIYSCPSCRKISRCNFLDQVLGIMINEDKRKDFIEPFWEKIQNSEYLNIIKKPICFATIKQDIRASKRYLMHPETFKADIMRIFWNARTFNPMQSDIHKAALRLNEKCSQILSQGRLWEIIETNAKASFDEERFSLFMRKRAKLWVQQKTTAKAINSSQTPEQLFDNQSSYQLKAKELFQLQEQLNTRQFGVNISDLERELQNQMDPEALNDNKTDCFCKTLSCLIDSQLLFGLLEEANRRLIAQNLNKRFDFADQSNRNSGKPFYDQEMYTNLSLLGQSSLSSQPKALVPFHKPSAPAQRDLWLQLIEELKNNEDRDGDWYSNPVKISFNDPSLIFVEMCYLCGSFGNQQDFLSCNLCGESFHPYCLPEPKDDPARFQDYWRCYNCIFCEKCHSSKQWEGLLICAVCDKVDHYWCLEPQLIQVPECNWKCPDCFKCAKCNSKQFFSPTDIQNRVNLDPNEKFIHSFDFEFCYQCGLEEYRMTFCNLCGDKSGVGQEVAVLGDQDATKPLKASLGKKIKATPEADCHSQLIFKCTVCNFYSHIECSKTTLANLEEVARRLGSDSIADIYKCIDCLIAGKLPNFYFAQQCELYENIHQSLRRQSMVRHLLNDILAKYFSNVDNVSASVQSDLYVSMFIEQNQEWLRQDNLVNQWILLLDNDLDVICNEQDSDSTLTNPAPQFATELDMVLPNERKETSWSEFDMREVVEHGVVMAQSSVRRDIYGHKEMMLPTARNLYLNLYFPELSRFGQDTHFMAVDELAGQMTQLDKKLQRLDLAELFVNIEFRAVLKIRHRFCTWFERVITQTLRQAKQFIPDEEPIEEHSVHTQNSQKQEVEMICTTSIKANLRERQPQKKDQSEIEQKAVTQMCTDDNYTVDNPQKVLQCVLCHQHGERKISGRLIPFQANKFVHVNCALWTHGIQEGHEEGILCTEIYNFHFAYRAYEHRVCHFCQQPGASLICNSKKCTTAYHFPCAYNSRKVQLREASTFCDVCTPRQSDSQPGLPIEFSGNHKKRIVIVKNILPQCTDAFDDQVRSKPKLHKQALSMEGAKKDEAEQAIESDVKKEDKNDVFVQCNNWSPYYYDMFNRVGNLTVLSLSRHRNALIENLHAFRHKAATWADRLNRKVSEKELPDYAAVRIYWKYADQEKYESMKSQANDESNLKRISGPMDHKGFYLFHDGDQVTEITTKDIDCLSRHLNLRLHDQLRGKVKPDSNQLVASRASDFWEQQIQNLRRRYSKFCQENTYLTVQSIQGLDKFPIQYWNNPGEKINLDLRDPKLASFFFKAAFKSNKTKAVTDALMTEPIITADKKASSLDSIFMQMLTANQVNSDNAFASFGDDDQHDLSTRHMNYEQIMARLGKKTLKVKIKERREKEKADMQAEQASSGQANQKSESDEQIAGFLEDHSESQSELADAPGKSKDGSTKRKGGAKTDGNDLSKGNDINQAMKYRAAKLNPKHVEVWISKIHRNGLFACQPLAPKDIVIEYVGEKIRESVANQREKFYEKLGVGDCYLFALDNDYIIDATFFGSKARYINHSCDPNLVSEKITVNGEKHIIFVANRHIAAEEELTFDYQFNPENETNKLECFCGTAKCRSRLN